jgi:hypothetical protein
MDDFMFMAHSREATLFLRDRVEVLLHRLGLQCNPKKGLWEPTQVGNHLGLTIDPRNGEIRAPIDNMQTLFVGTGILFQKTPPYRVVGPVRPRHPDFATWPDQWKNRFFICQFYRTHRTSFESSWRMLFKSGEFARSA